MRCLISTVMLRSVDLSILRFFFLRMDAHHLNETLTCTTSG